MTVPSWIAPNAELAEPRVKRFAERIAKHVGLEISEFWAAEPTLHDVEDREGNRWLEAWFCLRLDGCADLPMSKINGWRKTIEAWNDNYDPSTDRTEVLLSARVLN